MLTAAGVVLAAGWVPPIHVTAAGQVATRPPVPSWVRYRVNVSATAVVDPLNVNVVLPVMVAVITLPLAMFAVAVPVTFPSALIVSLPPPTTATAPTCAAV